MQTTNVELNFTRRVYASKNKSTHTKNGMYEFPHVTSFTIFEANKNDFLPQLSPLPVSQGVASCFNIRNHFF